MDYDKLKPGRIFVAPLLEAGYAFGYFTFADRSLMILGNIFDFLGDNPTPPEDIDKESVLLYDLQLGAEFLLSPKHQAGERWRLTSRYLNGPVSPRNRYYRMGGPPRSFRRIDILREEPDVPLTPDDSTKYPAVSKVFPPGPTAQVEVAVKRLLVSPKELIQAWRAKRPQ